MYKDGHDFAVLRQSSKNWYPDPEIGHPGDRLMFPPDRLNCANPNLNCRNPPRRDVILLPASGYVIIAFKADNPGYFSPFFFSFPFSTVMINEWVTEPGFSTVISPSTPHPVWPCRLLRIST